MITAVRAELLKITTTRLWWILLLCVVVLAAGYAALPAATALLQQAVVPSDVSPFEDAGTLRSIYNGGNTLTRILALVLGVMIMGSEYRHRTITTTYLATPRRLGVALAKGAAALTVGLAYGVVSVLMGIAVAAAFVLVKGGSFFLDQAVTWRSLALGVLSIGAWTLIGFAVGLLIRSMIIAMLVGIGFAYLVEPSLTVLFALKDWTLPLNLMPSGATNAMLEVTSPILFPSADPFAWWQALLVLAGWALLPAVLGVLFTVRRDVT